MNRRPQDHQLRRCVDEENIVNPLHDEVVNCADFSRPMPTIFRATSSAGNYQRRPVARRRIIVLNRQVSIDPPIVTRLQGASAEQHLMLRK
jgi:hypothetical protein